MKTLFLGLGVLLCQPILLARAENAVDKNGCIALVGWDGPVFENVNDRRYEEFAEAGFTHNISPFKDVEAMQAGLDLAATHGFKLFVRLPELAKDPEPLVRQFMDHPALAGYYIMDEPKPWEFDTYGRLVKRIQALDTGHPCFINLYPNTAKFALFGVWSYRGYLDRFLAEVPVSILSFDHYPITTQGLKSEWYKNLEIVSEKARSKGIPFWGFVLSTAHRDYPVPTMGHLRLQAYSNLAYGAQGIQYFTYWTNASRRDRYHGGPINDKGERTIVYHRVKQLNGEIRALSPVFAGSEVLSLGHTGGSIPKGTRRYFPVPPVQSLQTGGNGTVVSLLGKQRHRHLVVVNRNYEAPMPLQIDFDQSLTVSRWEKQGKAYPVGGSSFETTIDPGDAVILSWETQG